MREDRMVLFRGERYLFTAGGALTKPEDYAAFRESFAHVYPDQINRHGAKIGEPSELTDDGPYDGPEPTWESFAENGTWAAPGIAKLLNSGAKG